MRDKAKMNQKDLVKISETLKYIAKKEKEDLRLQRQDDKDAKLIAAKISVTDMNNNLKALDSAFMEMMNFEIYQKANEYKEKKREKLVKERHDKEDNILKEEIRLKESEIQKLKAENSSVRERLSEKMEAADNISRACAGKLEHLPEYRDDIAYFIVFPYRSGNYMLTTLIQERESLIQKKEEELAGFKEEKARLIDGMVDYKRLAEKKTKKIRKLALRLEEGQQKAKHAQNLIARIVLMLKRLVPVLLPEKKDANVTMEKAEHFLTLCGLSLEQKATILSFRNRSFPIESINEDTTVLGQPNYLRQDERKEMPEEKKEVSLDEMKKGDTDFQEYSRKVVKEGKLEPDSRILYMKRRKKGYDQCL